MQTKKLHKNGLFVRRNQYAGQKAVTAPGWPAREGCGIPFSKGYRSFRSCGQMGRFARDEPEEPRPNME